MFVGMLGFFASFVGVVWLVISFFAKKNLKKPLITVVFGFVLFIGGMATTDTSTEETTADGGEESSDVKNEDETDDYKTSPGEISNSSLVISLEIRSENVIQETEMIDGIKSVETNARKLHDQINDDTEEIYENVYQVNGVYSWENKRYEYVAVYSFDKNDVNEAGKILIYHSDLGNNIINKSLTTKK